MLPAVPELPDRERRESSLRRLAVKLDAIAAVAKFDRKAAESPSG